MRAKFHCDSVETFAWGNKQAKMSAVYDDGKPENNQFAEATPNANLIITIDKDAEAKDFLVPGKSYYLDFTEAES